LQQITVHTGRPCQGVLHPVRPLRATAGEQIRAEAAAERTEAALRSDARNAYLYGLPARRELHARTGSALTRRRPRAQA
jgi:hypothetical protein